MYLLWPNPILLRTISTAITTFSFLHTISLILYFSKIEGTHQYENTITVPDLIFFSRAGMFGLWKHHIFPTIFYLVGILRSSSAYFRKARKVHSLHSIQFPNIQTYSCITLSFGNKISRFNNDVVDIVSTIYFTFLRIHIQVILYDCKQLAIFRKKVNFVKSWC